MFRKVVYVVAAMSFAMLPLLAAFCDDTPSFQFFEPPIASAEAGEELDFQLFDGTPVADAPKDTRPVAYAYRPTVGATEGVSALATAADSLPVRLEWRTGGGFNANQYPVVHYQRPDGKWFYQYRATATALGKEFGKEIASAAPVKAGRWELQKQCFRLTNGQTQCMEVRVWVPE
jgi:hypothetical protein